MKHFHLGEEVKPPILSKRVPQMFTAGIMGNVVCYNLMSRNCSIFLHRL